MSESDHKYKFGSSKKYADAWAAFEKRKRKREKRKKRTRKASEVTRNGENTVRSNV